jgi:glycosyltransferase involved in cell wall biosynthesis
MSAPAVSVVVATRNRSGWLGELLESLRAQTLSREQYEVVVVDDGSTDGTPDVLTAEAQRGEIDLRIERHPESRGPATARERGWRLARAPIVAFTDDDCVADPRWLEAGLAACRAHPRAIVQGRTDPRPDQVDSFGPFSFTVEIHRAGPSYETCNIFYPREVLEELDGFDLDAFPVIGGEDTDLAWRAIGRGVPAEYADEVQVYHAVTHLGPRARLRLISRATQTMNAFARNPGLRKHLIKGVFWKWPHYHLFRTIVAALLPRRLWPLKWWLAAPYVAHLTSRRSGPLLVPWFVAQDVAEVIAVVRGAIRYRTPVI